MRTTSHSRLGARMRCLVGACLLATAAAVGEAQVVAVSTGTDATVPEHALVRGIVLDDGTRTPVVGAAIMLLDSLGELVAKLGRTDSAGFFEVVAPAAGEYRVLVRRDGYASVVTSAIGVASGESVQLELPLAVGGEPTGKPILVAREAIGQLHWAPDEFERRRAAQVGAFAGPRELRRSRVVPVRELLSRLGWSSAGAASRVGGVPSAGATTATVAAVSGPVPLACVPALRLNGAPVDAAEVDLLLLSTAELRAVEYYRPAEVPAELGEATSCGLVVLWTR